MTPTMSNVVVVYGAVMLVCGFALGWYLGRVRNRRLSTEEWIDAYLLGSGEGAAELVTQLLEEGRPHVRVDPSHRAK